MPTHVALCTDLQTATSGLDEAGLVPCDCNSIHRRFKTCVGRTTCYHGVKPTNAQQPASGYLVRAVAFYICAGAVGSKGAWCVVATSFSLALANDASCRPGNLALLLDSQRHRGRRVLEQVLQGAIARTQPIPKCLRRLSMADFVSQGLLWLVAFAMSPLTMRTGQLMATMVSPKVSLAALIGQSS